MLIVLICISSSGHKSNVSYFCDWLANTYEQVGVQMIVDWGPRYLLVLSCYMYHSCNQTHQTLTTAIKLILSEFTENHNNNKLFTNEKTK
jgi:hypothetical protein